MTKPVKILTYLHSFEAGGVERDILRFNGAWRDLGMDVRIALGRYEGPLAKEAPDVPFTVFQTGRHSTGWFETLWMIWHLPALIRSERPDAIFCAGNSYTIVAVALRLILGRKCPPIVYRVSNDLERRDMWAPIRAGYHLWLRLQAPAFAAIVAMADSARSEILEFMRPDPRQVRSIDNASLKLGYIDRLTAKRTTAQRNQAGRHFLGIGRLVRQKNFELLVEAFARIAQPEDRLILVGDGPRRTSIEAVARKLGVDQQVELAGYQTEIEGWMAQADAFVLSSDFEGVPAVIVEALAAGIPIVATRCSPALPSMLDGLGLLVAPRDVAGLAAAMDSITDHPADPTAMQARARCFTVEASMPRWRDLFAELAR